MNKMCEQLEQKLSLKDKQMAIKLKQLQIKQNEEFRRLEQELEELHLHEITSIKQQHQNEINRSQSLREQN